MNANTNQAAKIPATVNKKDFITLAPGETISPEKIKEGREKADAWYLGTTKTGKPLSGKQVKNKIASDKHKELRKETNQAKKDAVQSERDERRKLSFHFKQLQKFAENYIALLSKETGKKITVDDVQALKYGNFLPFLTEREDISNTLNGWTFNRLLSVVARYYRNESKNQVIASVLMDIE